MTSYESVKYPTQEVIKNMKSPPEQYNVLFTSLGVQDTYEKNVICCDERKYIEVEGNV